MSTDRATAEAKNNFPSAKLWQTSIFLGIFQKTQTSPTHLFSKRISSKTCLGQFLGWAQKFVSGAKCPHDVGCLVYFEFYMAITVNIALFPRGRFAPVFFYGRPQTYCSEVPKRPAGGPGPPRALTGLSAPLSTATGSYIALFPRNCNR